jgi:quinoprotein dehydrogenase-associated probable ABC transporter substrate-binding protein
MSIHRRLAIALLLMGCGGFGPLSSARAEEALRVCSDADNLPASNERGEGYENRIAQELARDLGRRLEYVFFPQRIGFVRHTLKEQDPVTRQFRCDIIIGVPVGYELAATTLPYMRSTYALVVAGHDELRRLQRAQEIAQLPPAKRHALRIGVFARSPGADWLLRNGMLEHAAVYTHQSGDPAETPALIVERELAAGKIDGAIVWGPIAGFLVRRHADAAWFALPFEPEPQIKFDYEIAMGVRFGEAQWKKTVEDWIVGHGPQVESILQNFGVPTLPVTQRKPAGGATDD